MNHETLRLPAKAYALLVRAGNQLRSPLLLLMRAYWGFSFFQTGRAKLLDHAAFVERFRGWGVPAPSLNVWIAASAECLGGLCLLAGFASRLVAIPLSITMVVAYLTADHEALRNILSEPDNFTGATPFLFLLTALLVLAFGPGAFSADHLLARKFSQLPLNAAERPRD